MGQQDLSGYQTTVTSTYPRPTLPQGIAEGAESCLRCNSYLALKNVSCEYHEGVLTLRGCLPSYYLKQMAQTAVARVAGVQRIVNEIEVIATTRR
jgi:osmotically-inducible protein OsmY